jgi:predicted RNA-binding Zn ribbon-like protein
MRLALALINSEEWHGRGPHGLEDHLDAPGWLEEFLASSGLASAAPPTSRERARLRRLRTLLRRMFTALAEGREPASADLTELDGFLRRGALYRRIETSDGYRIALASAKDDWDWALSEIAMSFAEVLADGERGRIKLCANPECLWAVYDESRNRRRRWCNSARCGNVYKVRAYRARQRARAPALGAISGATPPASGR